MKKLIVLIIMIGSMVGITFWSDDCSLFEGEGAYKSFAEIDEEMSDLLLTKEGLKRAIINLEAACCTYRKGEQREKIQNACSGDKNQIEATKSFPQSFFFLDHIFSVMMRRLGPPEQNYMGVPSDEKTKNWRKQMKENAENPNGVEPNVFTHLKEQEYEWEETDNLILKKYIWSDISTYRSDIKEIINKNNLTKEYPWRKLKQKYLNICQLAIYLASTAITTKQDSHNFESAQKQCSSLIRNTIKNDINYIKAISIVQSNRMLNKTRENYGENYFVQERYTNFVNKLTRLVSNLLWVGRLVWKLEKQCS